MTEAAYVTLALVPGIGRARLAGLLARFGSPEAVLGAGLDDLLDVPGMSRAAGTAIAEADPAQGARALQRAAALGGTALAPDHPAFPRSLREIPDAPVLLFASGNLQLLQQPCVAIVGSRSHTRYGAEVCRHLAGGLARLGLAVASGMARGLDAVAHGAALDAGGATIGVLGNGLGVVYPAANRALYDRVARAGCLLTEHAPGERPHAGSFPKRNRLISGLARATVVVEARERSGALLTADSALTQGREVLAVPGPVTSPTSVGCNRLIQLGAKPALGLRDVLEEYGMTFAAAPTASLPNDLTDGERQVLDALADGEAHVDDIARRLPGEAGNALAILTSLEIRGLVSQDPGKIFRRDLASRGAPCIRT